MDFEKEYGIELPNLKNVDDDENPLIVARFYGVRSNGEWYVLGGEKLDNGDYYLFGYVKGLIEDELGFFTINQITDFDIIIYDDEWKPIGLYDKFPELNYIRNMK